MIKYKVTSKSWDPSLYSICPAHLLDIYVQDILRRGFKAEEIQITVVRTEEEKRAGKPQR